MEGPSCHTNRFTTNSEGFTVVKEGSAEVLFPSLNDVFYNPVQEFNRDLTVAVIQNYHDELRNGTNDSKTDKGIKILEALAASGLRSIRFAKEIKGIESILANDLSRQAVDSIERNVAYNNVGDLVKPNNGDASLVMMQHKNTKDRFDVIDLDPYGSPSPFLDSAVQSLADGGLLCVTATDMAVLCGNSPETCYSKYGAISLKSRNCHEFAVRILLQCIESHANRYGRYIEPLLSLSIDFYVRVFVRIHSGQAQCKKSTSKLGHVYQCSGCESFAIQPLGRLMSHRLGEGHIKFGIPTGPPVGPNCEFCRYTHHVGGPIWIDKLHDKEFVGSLMNSLTEERFGTFSRMTGMLTMVMEELEDVPLYYELSRLCCVTKLSQGKFTTYLSAILNAGYRVSLTHANKHGIKTDAPASFIWSMMRAWAKKIGKKNNLSEGSAGKAILAIEDENDEKITFEENPHANPESRKRSLKRFQINPEKNWGPKMRSKASTLKHMENNKRIKNQGKNQGKKSKKDMTENGDTN